MNLNLFQLRSLKTRITLFTLLIFVVSIWSLALYISRGLHDDMQRQLGEQQLATASLIADDINQQLTDRLDALAAIADELPADYLPRQPKARPRLQRRPAPAPPSRCRHQPKRPVTLPSKRPLAVNEGADFAAAGGASE